MDIIYIQRLVRLNSDHENILSNQDEITGEYVKSTIKRYSAQLIIVVRQECLRPFNHTYFGSGSAAYQLSDSVAEPTEQHLKWINKRFQRRLAIIIACNIIHTNTHVDPSLQLKLLPTMILWYQLRIE